MLVQPFFFLEAFQTEVVVAALFAGHALTVFDFNVAVIAVYLTLLLFYLGKLGL